MVINRVGPVSCAKLAGILYAAMGLFIGAIFSLAAFAGAFAAGRDAPAGLGVFLGVGAIIVLPILYGVIGFIGALIGAALYNAAASVVGGVEIDVR
jgi:hypothetical protein